MLVEMKVFGLAIDPLSNTPIVILKDLGEKKAIPIWIGLFEASAIASVLEKISFARPMTHDLLHEVMKALDTRIVKIVINDLRNNTFFAIIHVIQGGREKTIDSRPSDAIALALRAEAPIFVDEKVIEQSTHIDISTQAEDLGKYSREKLKEVLETLSPEAFGKYKM